MNISEDLIGQIAIGLAIATFIISGLVTTIREYLNKRAKEAREKKLEKIKTRLDQVITEELELQEIKLEENMIEEKIENPIVRRWMRKKHESLEKIDVLKIAYDLELLSDFSIDEIEKDEKLNKILTKIRKPTLETYTSSNTDKKDTIVGKN